jgi:hypothetical protein
VAERLDIPIAAVNFDCSDLSASNAVSDSYANPPKKREQLLNLG